MSDKSCYLCKTIYILSIHDQVKAMAKIDSWNYE